MVDDTSSLAATRLAEPRFRGQVGTPLCRAHEWFVFCALLLVFGAASLAWSQVAAVLFRLLPSRLGRPLGQLAVTVGFRSFVAMMRLSRIIACDLRALDSLRDQPAVIIAPNHPSLLDAVFILSRLPQVGCPIKAELWDNVFLGGGARLAGFIRNDTPTTFIREAERQLRAGRHVLIFPEGTRTAGHTIGEFKSGFAFIAKRVGAPIQTVIIESNSRFLGKGWPLFRRPAFPLVYHVRLGRRLLVDCEVRGFVRDLRDYFGRELGCGSR